MDKNSIVLYKSGKFYNAYGDNGIILHKLLGYKFVSYKNSAGFPESAIESLKNLEMEERLSRLQSKLDNFTLDDLEKVVAGIEDGTIKE